MQERPTITATQHGGYIIVTAALSIVCMLLFLGIRLVVRRPWVQLFGLDDWAILFASVGEHNLNKKQYTDLSGKWVVPKRTASGKHQCRPWKGRVGAFPKTGFQSTQGGLPD